MSICNTKKRASALLFLLLFFFFCYYFFAIIVSTMFANLVWFFNFVAMRTFHYRRCRNFPVCFSGITPCFGNLFFWNSPFAPPKFLMLCYYNSNFFMCQSQFLYFVKNIYFFKFDTSSTVSFAIASSSFVEIT